MIVVFGGAFNPPTRAHFELMKTICNLSDVSRVILMPVGDQYGKAELIAASHRVKMLEILADKLNNVEVSRLEVDFSRTLKTLETLTLLKEVFPTESICFVMGADNLEELPTWYRYRELIQNFKILVVNRENSCISDYIKKLYPHDTGRFITLNDFSSLPISSSLFRKTYDSNLVENEVFDYILKNNLYVPVS